jgi:glutamate transport system permease protein
VAMFFKTLTDNWDVFSRGFLTTLELFIVGAIGALVLGTILAAMRVSPIPVLRGAGLAYVQLLRNTPLTLVFALLVFAVPKLGLDIDYVPTARVAIIVYHAAFVCEAIRSGINTVPAGQAEAGRALGMSFLQVLRLIVLPQAVRATVPPMVSILIALMKNTTVAAGFSVLEAGAIQPYLSERGQNQTYVLLWITIAFLVYIIPLMVLQRYLERRWRVAR